MTYLKKVALLAFVLVLTGCTKLEGELENYVLKKSGIEETGDYKEFQQLKNSNQLDEEGQFIDDDMPIDNAISSNTGGTIKVSFAKNQYISVSYYLDEGFNNKIYDDYCFLNPGDNIYASVDNYSNPYSNLYELSEYIIYECSENGKLEEKSSTIATEEGLIYTIPSDFEGTDLSIIPLGQYKNRDIEMEVFYRTDEGEKINLESAGKWTINDIACEDNITSIKSIDPYTLRFTYDTNNYFYVGCEPESFTKNPNDMGFVEFWKADPTEETDLYSVELQRYLTLELKVDKEAMVTYEQGTPTQIKKNRTWENEKLKYGDIIIVETEGTVSIVDGDYQHVSASVDPIQNGSRYAFKITQSSIDNSAYELVNIVDVVRKFDVSLSQACKHGECTYRLDGKVVSGDIEVVEGQKLQLTYKITDNNYRFGDNKVRNILNARKRTVEIEVSENLDNKTINPDDWFEIIQKGE